MWAGRKPLAKVAMANRHTDLIDISPDRMDPNPDNPRLVFREADMNQLLESIREVGIKVPLTVYFDNRRYKLIDGERRWRCARRLNLRTVPAIVQPKPGRLENLLMMFNIHNVRVDWDLMPMALKLQQVAELLKAEDRPVRPRDLAGVTGLSVATVNRALELLDLPEKYQQLLVQEAEKPRDKQQITADLFIEINKSKRVVRSYAPEVFKRVTEDEYVDSFVTKYRSGVVNNVVRFRDISRMARAERAGGSPDEAVPMIVDLVRVPGLRIEDAYRDTVRSAYETRETVTRITTLIDRLRDIHSGSRVARQLAVHLRDLQREVNRLLGDA